jgi:hypothetical protein
LHQIDILMLVECPILLYDLLNILNSTGEPAYFFSPGQCGKVNIYSKFSDKYIRPIYETDRLTIRHLRLPSRSDVLLAVTHFPSKHDWSDESQAQECVCLADNIKKAEEIIGHSRTILVGDLNMNPFEDGVVSARGLHAVMSRTIAKRIDRVVQHQRYPFFYNPMWSMLGDATRGAPGTYYYPKSEHLAYFWHMFDQVLIRPDLLERFRNEDMQILESDGTAKFLSRNGYPNKREYSDHLPILFRLEI